MKDMQIYKIGDGKYFGEMFGMTHIFCKELKESISYVSSDMGEQHSIIYWSVHNESN